jgi:hypothetical protein
VRVLSYDLAMDSSPRIAGKVLHGQNDNGVWESAKTDTLSYTVAHSSFEMRREQSHKHVVKSCTCKYGRDGGTGRRSGLKIRRPSGLGGSTPPPGTTPKNHRIRGYLGSLLHAMHLVQQTQRTLLASIRLTMLNLFN